MSSTKIITILARVQMVCLVGVAFINIFFPFHLYLWIDRNRDRFYISDNSTYFYLLLISGAWAFVTACFYKNLKVQYRMNAVNLFINLLLIGLFAYRLMRAHKAREILLDDWGSGLSLPVIAVFFLIMASVTIKKEIDILKFSHRIR